MIKKVLSSWFRQMLVGKSEIREFSTVGVGDVVGEKVYLQTEDQLLDVTSNQWMLGLEPLTFGIWIEEGKDRQALADKKKYVIYFRRDEPSSPEVVARGAVAIAELKYFNRIEDSRGTLFLLQVVHSSIHHVSGVKARLIYERFYKKPNVSFDKLKAVATAYSYPRRVRVISFQEGADYNYIFPMDLLGDIKQSGRYLLGMRHSNTVLKKIVDVRKIVVSEFPAEYKPAIYKLGRNHSASPPLVAELPFGVQATKDFGFFVPEWVESYKEVRILKTMDLGSHMLMFGEWPEDRVLKPSTPRLHHIHFLHFLQQKRRGQAYPLV
ncbi:MAG: hypothetical protein JST68_13870 [Bacteroidetes bacterium]|nr:hypothetical protein [Bacteroidota bacterium]